MAERARLVCHCGAEIQAKTIYTHADDLDGVVAAALLEHALPGATVTPLTYEQLGRIAAGPCVVADLGLPGEHPIWECPDAMVIDHHPATQAALSANGHAGTGRPHVRCRVGASAAALALECLRGPVPPALRDWAALADVGDRYAAEHPEFARARSLGSILRAAGFEFTFELVRAFSPGSMEVELLRQAFGETERRANDRGYRYAMAHLLEWSPGLWLSVLPAGSSSEVAHRMLGELGGTVALVNLGKADGTEPVGVAVRGERARELARLHGGDGHPRAAGFAVEGLEIAPVAARVIGKAAVGSQLPAARTEAAQEGE